MDEILVNEEGLKQFYDKLDSLKDLSLSNANTLSKSYNDYVGDGWHDNPEYEEAMRRNRMIDGEIYRMLKQEKKLKCINDVKCYDCVNIDDIIVLEFIYSDGYKEIDNIKLTGKFVPNTDLEIKEITLNSPIGRTIYKKKIGETCSYQVGNNNINIKIIEKANKWY